MYIVRITTTLPREVSFGVIPKESPTVLNAENTSKSTSFILAQGWAIKRMKEERKIMPTARVTTVNALVIDCMGRVLRKRLTESLAAIFDLRKANITPVVLVLTPPPVEPGEAPINIRMIKRKTAAKLSEFRFMVLKPAVRGVITWKREENTFSFKENAFSE